MITTTTRPQNDARHETSRIVQSGRIDGDVTVELIEHPYGVDDDGNTEESLNEIEDLES